MRIYNGTKSTMNIPMANMSRLIIGPMKTSATFYPSTDLLNLLVSAYSRDDIAIIVDSAVEMNMGAAVSAFPGYVANSEEEAIMRFRKTEESPKDLSLNNDKPKDSSTNKESKSDSKKDK